MIQDIILKSDDIGVLTSGIIILNYIHEDVTNMLGKVQSDKQLEQIDDFIEMYNGKINILSGQGKAGHTIDYFESKINEDTEAKFHLFNFLLLTKQYKEAFEVINKYDSEEKRKLQMLGYEFGDPEGLKPLKGKMPPVQYAISICRRKRLED